MNACPRLPLPAAYADPAFMRCLGSAIALPELVHRFDRLRGATLMSRTTPGKATDMRAFVEFVHDSVYLRLPDEAIAALRAD